MRAWPLLLALLVLPTAAALAPLPVAPPPAPPPAPLPLPPAAAEPAAPPAPSAPPPAPRAAIAPAAPALAPLAEPLLETLPEPPLRPPAPAPPARAPAPAVRLERLETAAALPAREPPAAPAAPLARDAPAAPRPDASSPSTAAAPAGLPPPRAREETPRPAAAPPPAAAAPSADMLPRALLPALVLALLAPFLLYHRMRGGELLHSAPRRRLLDLLAQRPGMTAADAARALEVDPTTALYHLRRLVLARAVLVEERRYFLAGASDGRERARLLALHHSARVLQAVRASPGACKSALARRLAIARPTLALHLARLERADLVRSERGGRSVRIFPKETLS